MITMTVKPGRITVDRAGLINGGNRRLRSRTIRDVFRKEWEWISLIRLPVLIQ